MLSCEHETQKGAEGGELHTGRNGITWNWQLDARRMPTSLPNLS